MDRAPMSPTPPPGQAPLSPSLALPPLPQERAEAELHSPHGARSSRSVRFADAESLAASAVIRNTFIDIPVPLEGGLGSSASRSGSVPPSLRLAGHADGRLTPVAPRRRAACTPTFRLQGAGDVPPPERRLREAMDATAATEGLLLWRSPSASSDSGDSTIPSEGDRRKGAARHSWPQAVVAAQLDAVAAQLGPPAGLPVERADGLAAACHCAAVVERECGFLRLRGHTVHLETHAKAKRRGVVAVVRFYVRGLPWAKRAKWLQPLLWSVMAVLQSRDFAVAVRGGNLYMGVSADGSVRMDFAAARD